MLDYISGEKFKAVADFTFAPLIKLGGDYDNLVNTFKVDLLKDQNIVYTHTMYVDLLFDVISKLDKKFVIITHNSDCSIEDFGIAQNDGGGKRKIVKIFNIPKNVIKWYSQNVNTLNEKVESIPIGLENNRWFTGVRKKEKMINLLNATKQYKNLVYMNHNVGTNPDKRTRVYQILEHQPWVTVEKGWNGHGFDEYIKDVYNHKYVICPEGNGIDTIRFWETLYMGSVPVVKKNINNWFYNALPILYVNEWEDVTKELLDNMWGIFEDSDWDGKELNFSYWRDKIHGTFSSNN